jgi:hypothetical protein
MFFLLPINSLMEEGREGTTSGGTPSRPCRLNHHREGVRGDNPKAINLKRTFFTAEVAEIAENKDF